MPVRVKNSTTGAGSDSGKKTGVCASALTPSSIAGRNALWLSLCLPVMYRRYYHCLGTDAVQYDINFYQVARRHFPEQRNNHGHCRENHKPHLFCPDFLSSSGSGTGSTQPREVK